MNFMLVAICDEVSGQWSAPFYARNEAEAVRDFSGAVLSLPEYMRFDAALYHVGDVFIDSGVYHLQAVEVPRRLVTGRNVSVPMDKEV